MKKMTNLNRSPYWLLAVLLVANVSCDSFLDVNQNPNSPETINEDLRLATVLGNFSYRVIGNDPPRTANLWTQQLAFNGVPLSEDNYQLTEQGTNNLWAPYSYVSVMKNAYDLIGTAEANGNRNHAAIARIILAWNISVITDLFNDAPYSEAFQAEELVRAPAYDSQEQIYQAIFGLLQEAIADIEAGAGFNPGTSDLLYGGNMESWRRLAHMLEARFHMRLSLAPGNSATDRSNQALEALQEAFTSNADNADFVYTTQTGEENPWYQYTIDGKWSRTNQMSVHYIDLLESLDDPRLPVQARPVGEIQPSGAPVTIPPEEAVFAGHRNGEESVGVGNVSSIGRFYSNADASLNWINYAEAKFLEAEALYRTNGAAAAQTAYEEGIRASMEQLGVAGEDIDAYVAAQPELAAADDALASIITQKYIANFLNYEVYNDWRRTGYPELELAEDAIIGQIPVRFPYPVSEWQNNEGNVAQTGVPQGPASMTHSVWWDTRN